jgi:hypothetical protein
MSRSVEMYREEEHKSDLLISTSSVHSSYMIICFMTPGRIYLLHAYQTHARGGCMLASVRYCNAHLTAVDRSSKVLGL